MRGITAVRARLFPPDQLGYGSYLRLVQLVPEDPRGAGSTGVGRDTNNIIRRDNHVQPEVVRGLGQVLVQDLEGMDGRGDGRPVADHPRLPGQGELEVGVASTLADPDSLAVDGNRATHDQVDGGHRIEADGHALRRGAPDRDSLAGGYRDPVRVEAEEGEVGGPARDRNVNDLALRQGRP